MGPAGLTAVFGMGTGGTPPVSSPEIRPAGGQARRAQIAVDRSRGNRRGKRCGIRPASSLRVRTPAGPRHRVVMRPAIRRRPGGRGGRIGVVKRSAVRTGRLRRSPAVHSRPIDLVVFQEPSHYCAGNLVLEGASRLDAFSAYPVPTWLPGGAPSGTAGTPEVGPPQSSRTRGDAPQVSSAHGR